jgi:hypothetical protein
LGELGFELMRRANPWERILSRGTPAELSQGPNLYAYVVNDPLNKTDPLGSDFAGIVDWLIPDYIACVGRCVEQKDPVNQLNEWLVRPGHLGCPIPYTFMRKMGWPQKLGTRLTNLLSIAHETGHGGRWLRIVGRVLSPANTLYGWWMVGKEVECAAQCAGDPKAY